MPSVGGPSWSVGSGFRVPGSVGFTSHFPPARRGARNKKLTPSWLQSKMVSEAKRGFLLGEAKRGRHFFAFRDLTAKAGFWFYHARAFSGFMVRQISWING